MGAAAWGVKAVTLASVPPLLKITLRGFAAQLKAYRSQNPNAPFIASVMFGNLRHGLNRACLVASAPQRKENPPPSSIFRYRA